jgi:hypothetical protein
MGRIKQHWTVICARKMVGVVLIFFTALASILISPFVVLHELISKN